MVLNDWWLKGRGPGWATGRLSDLAGLFLLPLIVVSLAEVVRRLARRGWPAGARLCASTCIIVALGFTLVKTVPTIAAAFGFGIGVLQWPAEALWSLSHGDSPSEITPIEVVVDPSDLFTVPAVVLAYFYLRRRRICPSTSMEPVHSSSRPDRVTPGGV